MKSLTTLTLLLFLTFLFISCEAEDIRQSDMYENVNPQSLHKFKDSEENSGGGSGDNNPGDYDPFPDGVGDVDYPGLNPDNEPSDENNSTNPEPPSSNPIEPSRDPNVPLNDFEHAN
ncbi:hypothetical protein JM658_03270 [Joostella atrarenae]|uniref:Uncharacterized protein n=1 Tax=Joostella atrarenae TaxID=679257 RepID=A0ABS9J077_9FLAO|nr:hypothetical protein [Joostella atrarenae]MCF8713837.1 hypothetical protein [Joostella atrarenae]